LKEKIKAEEHLRQKLHIEAPPPKVEVSAEIRKKYERIQHEWFNLCELKLDNEARTKSEQIKVNVEHKFCLQEKFEEWQSAETESYLFEELDEKNRFKWLKEWDVQYKAATDGKY
jgi:hypothetical protein